LTGRRASDFFGGGGIQQHQQQQLIRRNAIVRCRVPLKSIFFGTTTAVDGGDEAVCKGGDEDGDERLRRLRRWEAFCAGNDDADNNNDNNRTARAALADYVSRTLSSSASSAMMSFLGGQRYTLYLERLDRLNASTANKRRHRRTKKNGGASSSTATTPFSFERTDVWCDNHDVLHVYLRAFLCSSGTDDDEGRGVGVVGDEVMTDVDDDDNTRTSSAATTTTAKIIETMTATVLSKLLLSDSFGPASSAFCLDELMKYVSTAVFQERLRRQLAELDAVAFVADRSVLPRRSGASFAPMASPPAVPFRAPEDSPMTTTVRVDMGKLRTYLTGIPTQPQPNEVQNGMSTQDTVVTLRGLLIPTGVSLIVGGGYHGKSTMLRTIAAGVYNKIPGDGREFCVTVSDAVTVRAEDGRYVNNCNVSAFISNLPTPPGASKALDTAHFSSGEASGSTSQAANVVDAIEMGASALLVDEDVSAANFMARDGRMRSLVMDESITPLLYRVNGLYNSLGISSVVVVGGVGDWLDVPNSVVLMDKYTCRDATKKAQSVSRQFSHGHVQYAGRGVVHRLPWDKSGTPFPRKPTEKFARLFDRNSAGISLLDGSDALSLHRLEHLHDDSSMVDDDEDDDDEDHIVDLSRCEQLMGKKPQLYGCGLCTLWLLEASHKNPGLGLADLLKMLDSYIDKEGFAAVVGPSGEDENGSAISWKLLIETAGCAFRPRKYEVGHTVTRFRGIEFEEIPVEDDGVEAAAKAEAERKKRQLLELWNARRKNKLNDGTD